MLKTNFLCLNCSFSREHMLCLLFSNICLFLMLSFLSVLDFSGSLVLWLAEVCCGRNGSPCGPSHFVTPNSALPLFILIFHLMPVPNRLTLDFWNCQQPGRNMMNSVFQWLWFLQLYPTMYRVQISALVQILLWTL